MADRFNITLNQLTYFSACAKHLNMTAASQELHVAQSAVSAAIGHVERTVGAQLFVRQHAKGLILTPEGESLLRSTNEVFGLLSSSITSIQDSQGQVRGTVRLACFSTVAPFLLPRLLRLLETQHPELTVEVTEGDHDENIAALRSGRAEIAVNYRFAAIDGIAAESLGRIEPHVLVGQEHRLADRTSVGLAEFEDDGLILLDLPGSRDYFLNMFVQAGVTPRLRYRTRSYETVRSMVGEGLGYSILNQRPADDMTYSGFRTRILRITDPVPSLEVVMMSLAGTPASARVQAVAQTVKSILGDARTNRAEGA
ncbi:LysR family transcriptional regulator [Brevibacterium moorei]|jgi:DNA-binding transcriptional LysR family regulator|uniref:LysR family transcriptional regulator n=1 Tax=Brevibacterium moorei TaxID=2968457 RepID=UPI00211B8779|nr:LysR family transcriptional regulator [Brevibacterium sp. 68QC2CO]MCQ9386097.1 LysR family transcriptional regulator [Brevibacterium sp. 68QC2CO]